MRQLLQRQLRKLGWKGSCRIQVWFGCDFWFASLLCFFRQSDGNQEISPPVEAAMMCKNCRPQQHELLLPRPGHYCWKGASMKQVAWSCMVSGIWCASQVFLVDNRMLNAQTEGICYSGKPRPPMFQNGICRGMHFRANPLVPWGSSKDLHDLNLNCTAAWGSTIKAGCVERRAKQTLMTWMLYCSCEHVRKQSQSKSLYICPRNPGLLFELVTPYLVYGAVCRDAI